MTGDQIQAALEDRKLYYDGAEQEFHAAGQTTYVAGRPSLGSWAVRADQYCSQWPPNDQWECYDMESATGAVRFLDAYGNITEGRYDK